MSEATKKALVPVLRFPEFQDAGEWEQKAFGKLGLDLSDGNYSSKYPRQSDFIKNGVPFLRANNLKFGTVTDEDMRFISKDQHNQITKGHLKKGDILISTRGELGIIALVPDRHIGSNINAQIVRINTNNKMVNTFLFQLLDYSKIIGLFDALSTGTALKQLPIGKLNQLTIPIPKAKEEQQKIADCLSSIDELVTAQTQKIEALKAHKKGLMQQLFPAEGETVPKLRFPEFRDAGEWKEDTLGGAATFLNGRAYKQEELLDQGKYRVLRVGNFFSSNEWYYSDLELDENKYCEDGDLLYAWSASFGPRIWKGGKTIYHYHIWKILEKKGIDKNFLYILLAYETERMKSQSANGLGLLHITKGTIEGWKCYFPKIDEQKKIADCLSSIDELVTAQTQKLAALKAHKKGLMQQLFPAGDEVIG